MGTVITNNENGILFPSNVAANGWFKLPNYTSKSKEVVLDSPTSQTKVSKGEKMRLWYGEDIKGRTEQDNHGKSCADVYADVQCMFIFLIYRLVH